MSAVNITNVTVLDNPAAFLNPFQFEISYECLVPLEDGMVMFQSLCLVWIFESKRFVSCCFWSYCFLGFPEVFVLGFLDQFEN